MPRCLVVAWLAALIMALSLPAPAAPLRHGPVHFGTGPDHQHGPVHYGNGPDTRRAPGVYRSPPEAVPPSLVPSPPRIASPVIIVEPRRRRFHRPHRRVPHHGQRGHRGDTPWFLEDDRAFRLPRGRPETGSTRRRR
ncbi:hypothetical protein LG302_01715 [Halomonas organivorans]